MTRTGSVKIKRVSFADWKGRPMVIDNVRSVVIEQDTVTVDGERYGYLSTGAVKVETVRQW